MYVSNQILGYLWISHCYTFVCVCVCKFKRTLKCLCLLFLAANLIYLQNVDVQNKLMNANLVKYLPCLSINKYVR